MDTNTICDDCYRLTVRYDENKDYEWDATIADKFSTVNLYTPSGKCYTKVFYREGRKVVEK
jgi:hypothetical protein